MSIDDDREHDAHLQAALRHAPDASLAAPPSLGDAILLQARIAARAASASAPGPVAGEPARSRPRWIDALDRSTRWLSRPAVAAGFASVTAATLIGLMWWDRPMELAETPNEAPSMATPGTAALRAKDDAAPTASPAAPPRQLDEVDRRASTIAKGSAPAEPVSREPRVNATVAPPAPADQARTKTSSAVAQTDASLEARAGIGDRARAETVAAEKEGMDASKSRSAAAAPVPAPPLPLPLQPAPATPTTALAPAPTPAVVAALSAPAPAEEVAPTNRYAPAATARQQAPMATNNLVQRRAKEVDLAVRPSSVDSGSPLEALRLSIASEPARWRWRRDGSGAQPMSDAVLRWVDAFDTGTLRSEPSAGSTNRVEAGAAPQAFRDVATAPLAVELLRDGAVQATLKIDAEGRLAVATVDAPERQARARLSPAALADLRARAPLPAR